VTKLGRNKNEEVDMEAVATLKAELAELNLKCQQARDNEVRYALQRSRLEAERASLLVRIVDAMAPLGPVPAAPPAPYHVVAQQAASAPAATATPVDEPRPTLGEMVLDVLHAGPMKTGPIIKAIHAKWPDARSQSVYIAVIKLRRSGRIQTANGVHSLPQTSTNGVAKDTFNAHFLA
jgi:hypothetical protein